MDNTVGHRIKTARKRLGLSQEQLAKQTHVSQPTVANWENGSHAPRHSTLTKIASALDASSSWLLGEGADASASTLAPLSPQVHHIPVLPWPQTVTDLDEGTVSGYISLAAPAKRPFALITQDKEMSALFPLGSQIIFDRSRKDLSDGASYLISHNGRPLLRQFASSDNQFCTASGNSSPVLSPPAQALLAKNTEIIAKVILHMKTH